MGSFRSFRLLLLALMLTALPASSFAAVFISVGFAPPALPVYDQPPCPEPGMIWTPGYWAYGPDGYYWVPGAWVPAPYPGALWTPPYWGWEGGMYILHPGYWGPHVGYYGGVNYGFGYMGVGFVGGYWRNNHFLYNTAVMHVNPVVIHDTYIDRAVVERNTIRNDRRVAFSGGPGGIRHEPTPAERIAARDRHVGPTSFQAHQEEAFRGNREAYAKFNGGRPATPAVARPLSAESHAAPERNNQAAPRPNMQQRQMQQNQQRSFEQNRPGMQPRTGQQSAPQTRSMPTYRTSPESRQAEPGNRTAPQMRSAPAQRQQAPAARPAPQQQQRSAPPQEHEQPRGNERPR